MNSSKDAIREVFISTSKHYVHAIYEIIHNKFLDFFSLEMEPIGFPATSLRNIPKESRSHLIHGGSLTSST